jgi:DNA replication protein DnaC
VKPCASSMALLKHARLDHSYEAELRKLLAVDVLLVDDFGLDAMDATESRDVHEILTERNRAGSMIITSKASRTGNVGP